jgi:hypothetical protein
LPTAFLFKKNSHLDYIVSLKVILKNGFDPVFNAAFRFPLTVPEMAVLVFVVMNSNPITSDSFIGQYALQTSDIM